MNKDLDIDIVIPAYFEGESIISLLDSLEEHVKSSFRIFICYDTDDDNTLSTVNNHDPYNFEILFVKNKREGLHGAVLSGFDLSTAPAVMMMPADDSWNSRIIDEIVKHQKNGADIVCPSRFMKGGGVKDYPFFKYLIVRTAAFLLYKLAFIPTQDPTNGFRCFSRRVIDQIPIESTHGGTFSIELLVKCHRLGWEIKELPSLWSERKLGKSRFKILDWAPHYIVWLLYGFATTYLRKKRVILREKNSRNSS